MRRQFEGKVVVVTGASSGVGRAIARAFGAEHARVGLLARGRDGLSAAAEEIRRAGGEAILLPCDVSSAAEVDAAADEVMHRWGRIDVWVNDAMISVFSPVAEMTADEYRKVTAVDYLGTVYGTLAALRIMRRQNEGTIIQIGSALVYRSIPLQSAYCASKAAVRGFTDSLRCELRHDRSPVRVSMLQLPAVNTPQFDVVRSRLPNEAQPVPPIYQPEVIARAVLYAARRHPRELWIAGSAIKAIVGQRFLPGLADRYLGRVGYRAQQTNEPRPPDQPDNIDGALPGDRGARGRFDARARSFSAALWARTHPIALATLGALGIGGVVAVRQLRA